MPAVLALVSVLINLNHTFHTNPPAAQQEESHMFQEYNDIEAVDHEEHSAMTEDMADFLQSIID